MKLAMVLCLISLTAAAQTSSAQQSPVDPNDSSVRVISTPQAELDESRLVKAVRGAAEARLTSEAKVHINQRNLAYERKSGSLPSGITRSTEAGRLTFKKIETVDPVLTLNAMLATTSNVKVLKNPRDERPPELIIPVAKLIDPVPPQQTDPE